MKDKLVNVAAMLDASDGERNNAATILQRMLASRDKTLTDFLRDGLAAIGLPFSHAAIILQDAVFPFDEDRIERLTNKLKDAGLTWRAVAEGKAKNFDEAGLDTITRDPYDAIFAREGRKTLSKPAETKVLYEWPRESLPKQIVAMLTIRDRQPRQLLASAWTQDAETVISFGNLAIQGEEAIEKVLDSVRQNRATMFTLQLPRDPAQPIVATPL